MPETAFSFAGWERKKYVEIDPERVRPAEVDCLCGDASKAPKGWRPEVNFQQLTKMMVEADLAVLKLGRVGRSATVAS